MASVPLVAGHAVPFCSGQGRCFLWAPFLVLSSSWVGAVPIQLGQFRFVRAILRRSLGLALICFAWQLLLVRAVRAVVVVVGFASPCILWQRFAGQFLKTQTGCGQHNRSFKLTALRYAILLCIRCAHYCTTKLLRSARQLNSGVMCGNQKGRRFWSGRTWEVRFTPCRAG